MKLTLRMLISVIFGVLAYIIIDLFRLANMINIGDIPPQYVTIFSGVLIAIIFYFFISTSIVNLIFKIMGQVEDRLVRMNVKELIVSIFGALIGLIIANLVGLTISSYGLLGTIITLMLNIILGYLGFRVAQKKKEEISLPSFEGFKEKKSQAYGRPKILDTSVIIDGRILDLFQTGFIEGKVIIPSFVLQELRHIADSSDSLKRNRGRRGLDILNEIQKQLKVPVEILEWDNKDNAEVDIKLLKMAKKINGYVVTNDFNLNKVADFQGVSVLNINELSNAIKPIVLPGEGMTVAIVKDGKENGQGIGYLNDGTMIVVEGGHKFLGETIEVLVTSVLQTSAGRMIFTKKKDAS